MPKTEKCTRCGWFDGQRFHVCFVPTETTAVQRENEYEETQSSRRMRTSQREAISEAHKERWRAVNRDRDLKIVERYAEGDISYVGLADEFGVSRSTIFNVMRSARAAGVIQPSSPGNDISSIG